MAVLDDTCENLIQLVELHTGEAPPSHLTP
jgi:hypothetical protein